MKNFRSIIFTFFAFLSLSIVLLNASKMVIETTSFDVAKIFESSEPEANYKVFIDLDNLEQIPLKDSSFAYSGLKYSVLTKSNYSIIKSFKLSYLTTNSGLSPPL